MKLPAGSQDEFARFQDLARNVEPGCRLLHVERLTGGVSAQLISLEVETRLGARRKIVARFYGKRDLAQRPSVASDEYRLLKILESTAVPAPRALFVDARGEQGLGPCVIIEYVLGQTELSPGNLDHYVDRLSETLAAIHDVDLDRFDLSFLPRCDTYFERLLSERPTTLDTSLSEDRIRNVLESRWPVQRINPLTLLHGDFWPGNVLWFEEEIAAVVDWEDAALGDPLADLANTRLELMWLLGWDEMERFTERYLARSRIETDTLALWDLLMALRPVSQFPHWGLPEHTEQRMRSRHRQFVNNALDNISR